MVRNVMKHTIHKWGGDISSIREPNIPQYTSIRSSRLGQNPKFVKGNIFGAPLSTPYFALLSHFWVKIRALLLPNLQRWPKFDSYSWGLNSDEFPFFKTSLALLEA